MQNDAIFLVTDDGGLQRIEHQFYASEDILQELVAKHPDVLAGDQIDPSAPPRWLLIRREATIPDSAEGADRWWLDHLLLDQFGIPTLVEVKRSTDTRIRREVVGQMLDYVANAQAYWAAGRMRQMLNDELGSGAAADSRLAEHLGIDNNPEATAKELEVFWHKVEANMREGNVRLLFVADELPRELKRLIEFLNEQFTKIEVLGIELRQYVGQGIKALVPRVVGQTEAARDQKERSSSPRAARALTTDRAAFLTAVGADATAFFQSLFEEADKRELQVAFGGKSFKIRAPGEPPFFYGYLPGANGRSTAELELYFRELGDPGVIEDTRAEFTAIPGLVAAGKYTLRMPVTSSTLDQASDVFAKAADLMEQQRRSPDLQIGGRGSGRVNES